MGQGTEGLSTQQPTTGERSTEELSREIAGTRQALATDLDACRSGSVRQPSWSVGRLLRVANSAR